MRMRILFVCCVALALTVGVATATGGNSPNAKLCQKNGWKTLYRSDGSPFTNQDACVAYAAKGGTFAVGTLTINVVVNTVDGTGSATQDFPFALSGGTSGQTFSLDDDNNSDATLPASRVFSLLPGSYTVAQVGSAPPSGWAAADLTCNTDANSSATTSLFPPSATINLAVFGNVSCTFTYSQLVP